MDTKALTSLIDASQILSTEEKGYWKENMQYMNGDQTSRLEDILKQAADIPWTKIVSQYLSMLGGVTKSYLSNA